MKVLFFWLSAFLALPAIAQAAVINVTVSADKTTIAPGETAILSVYGQLKEANAVAGNGIFGWDVNLRDGNESVVQLLTATLDRSGWTQDAFTSSAGTSTSWGLHAIYDTSQSDGNRGVVSPARLFSIQFKGLSEGVAAFSLEPDTTTGVDFVTWKTQVGGDYSQASIPITVTPEPSSLLLSASGGMALLRRRRRRLGAGSDRMGTQEAGERGSLLPAPHAIKG